MRKLKYFILSVAASLCISNVHAESYPAAPDMNVSQQSGKVTGVVLDEFGPVAGAAVTVKGTTRGIVTDVDGNFSLDVNNGETIVVSFLGYTTREIVYKGESQLTVTLSEDTQALDEVVVTALGMKRSQKALGYAMKELKGDELNTNLVNPVAALQGKVAGVDISGSDGGMFGSTKILIRGVSTLGKNNQPIYVVDGVILDNPIKDGNPDWDGQANDYGNELKNLNPDDFESVTILKGAAATSLYGSRGLNGAVVITTKSGKTGAGLGINVTQTFGLDAVTSAPDLQNVFGNGYIAGYVNYGDKDANGNYYARDTYGQFYTNSAGQATLIGSPQYGFGPAFDGRNIEYYDGTTRSYKAYKNRFKDAYDKGFSSNSNIAISGGNDKTSFYTSLSYMYKEGILPNNEFNRFSFLGKVSHNITKRARIDISMNFANSNPKNAQRNIGENFVDNTWTAAYDVKYGKTRYKGAHGGIASNSYGDEWGNMQGNDIWWDIYENNREQVETVARPTARFELDITDWLKFNAEGSYNYLYKRYEAKEKGGGYANSGGYYEMSMTTKEQTNYNANFVFNKTFGDWAVNGFLRGEYYEGFQQYQMMKTDGGLVVPNQFFITNSKNAPKYEAKISNTKKILSVAFQAGLSWKDQLFVDVTGRNDWSSALVYADDHGNYSYFYPSVSGSWLITNTLKEQLPSWVSFAKVRASWAQVGNDTNPYDINSAYTLGTATTSSSTYYGLSIPSKTYDNDLKPEKKTAWEVGLDWRFIDNRIGVDFTYYKENTKNQIMTISVPYQSGITEQLINAGNIQNQGIELALNLVPVKTKDFEWGVDLTWTKNKNKIVSLHENVADWITLSGDAAYGNFRIASVAKVGSSYGTLMTDSEKKYDKDSGLPILGWNDTRKGGYYFRNEEEIVEIGSILPDFTGGFATNFRYKDWTLNVALDMRFGGYIASYNSRYGSAYGHTTNSLKGAPGHGGVTWTSSFDGKTYYDGVIPEGLLPKGTVITQPNGSTYTVTSGGVSSAGESYQELVDKKVIEPTHASYWNYINNAWTMAGRDYGVVSEDWVKELNYIALRNVSLSYRVPSSFCNKIKSKGLNLIMSGYNLGYLLNTAPTGENPESVSGTAPGEFRIRSYQGVTSSFMFTINATF